MSIEDLLKDKAKQIKLAEIDETDQRLIKCLIEYSDRTPDRWGEIRRLGEKLFPEKPKKGVREVTRRLETLPQKLALFGVQLQSRVSRTLGDEVVYAIDRTEVQRSELKYLPVFHRPKEEASILFISDPAFGHIYHNSVSDLGAHYFLNRNHLLEKLDAVIVLGGLPFIPDRTGKVNNQYHKVLGKKAKNTSFPDEEDPSGSELDPREKDFRVKHVDDKITTIPEAVEKGAESLLTILGEEYEGEVHYHLSFNDQENIEVIRRRLASDLSELKEKQKKHERTAELLEKRYEEQNLRYTSHHSALEFLEELHAYLIKDEAIEDKPEETTENIVSRKIDLKQKISHFQQENKNRLSLIDSNNSKLYSSLIGALNSLDSTHMLAKEIEKMTQTKDRLEEKVNTLKQEWNAQIAKAADVEQTMRNYRVYRFLGHMPMDGKTEQIHQYQAMEELLEQVRKLWPKWRSKANIHPERVDLEIKGYTLRVEPRVNRRSNVPGFDTIRLQQENIRENAPLGKPIPDVYASGYDAGGYRAYPTPAQREKTIDGCFETDERTMLHLKLPTMQSKKGLEYCLINNIDRIPDVKRYQKKNNASGIVILNFIEEGVYTLQFASEGYLEKLGLRAERYEAFQEQLKSEQDLQQRESIKKTMAVIEESFKITPRVDGRLLETIDILLMPESHVGSQTPLGRTSNIELVEAVVEYEKKNHNLDLIIFGGDNVHGDHNTKGLRTAAADLGLLPHEIKKVSQLIMEDQSITADQKIILLAQFAYINRTTQPMTSSSKQFLELADDGALELAEKTIDQEGMVIMIKGNHHDSTEKTHDETHLLALGMDRKYRKSGRLHLLDGPGERDGRGDISLAQLHKKGDLMTPEDYGTIYAGHSFRNGTDPLLGAMNNVKGMALDAHALFTFHLHCAGTGYADERHVFMGPGGQATTRYVDVIGQIGAFRGAMNVELSRNPEAYKGYQKTTFVSLRYLQQHYLNTETWAHQRLVEEYIPRVRGRLNLTEQNSCLGNPTNSFNPETPANQVYQQQTQDETLPLTKSEEEARIKEIKLALEGAEGNVSKAAISLEIDRTTLHRQMSKFHIENTYRQSIDRYRSEIEDALEEAEGVIAQAARELGIKENTFKSRVHRLGIDPESYRIKKD